MAIAYFIPDQTKLLAAGNSNGQQHHQQNNQQQQQPTSGAAPGGNPLPNNDGGSTYQQQQQHTQNHNFRANITIPLAAYASTAPENVGCWDLITQIFCYALRFCHETRLSPAVIEISFEFNGGLQQQVNSTSTNASTIQGSATNITTTATVPPTTASNSAVGNATTTIHASMPQATVAATARVDNRTNVTAARQNVGRSSSGQMHRTSGRRSGGTSRRN